METLNGQGRDTSKPGVWAGLAESVKRECRMTKRFKLCLIGELILLVLLGFLAYFVPAYDGKPHTEMANIGAVIFTAAVLLWAIGWPVFVFRSKHFKWCGHKMNTPKLFLW